MKKSFLILMTLVCLTAVAQETFEIRNVTLFDGEKVFENAKVLIENGKVSEVSTPNIDGDHEAIDGTGKFLMPSLSNA
ncbi:MAG: amidohydrolase family protein, partial [Aurantibacter sp.]